ncbi:flagellar biosynthetic protein FliO [Candidatus Symbiopectobacterium sp. 'North America']|uniref:flagellar biosynthetic protein FliO n=1 Tax=Candidatus Symbiopectobacterium sp. 'North America' TaxID=2794574 RepID=UPI0018C99A7B|nr:flagellar biosynthetic protein FliO [Candidatus Symbiopectobacterium sp. 'North America']MBG6245371.1 flagellar biosynthetic protein FliO [Candidatus Symbiopectobacterium sp. 'North America']
MADTQPLAPARSAPISQATTQVTTAPFPTSTLLTQVGTVLVGVLMLILAIAWVVRKLGLPPPVRQNKLVKVVSSCQIGQRERVVVVEIEDTWLVLGVTTQQITPLHTLPVQEMDDAPAGEMATPANFRQLLHKVIKRPEKSE